MKLPSSHVDERGPEAPDGRDTGKGFFAGELPFATILQRSGLGNYNRIIDCVYIKKKVYDVAENMRPPYKV